MKNLDELFRQVAAAQDGLSETTHRLAVVRQRISQMGEVPGRLHAPSWQVLVWSIGLLATAAGAATLLWGRQNQPITVTVGVSQAPASSGTWVDAPAISSLPLRFSDGSRIEVAPQAKMRVLELGRQGAKLALESGRAGVEVAPGEHRRWELRAGPFNVHVTGTRFDMSWLPKDDQFELVLSEGQVEITGCGFGDGRRLVAGQTVHASCRDGSVNIAYSGAAKAAGAGSPDSAAPVATEVDASRSAPSAPKTQGATTNGASSAQPIAADWRRYAQEGKYAEALAAAEQVGFDAECARADAAGVALLGEAAYRAQKPDRAQKAWLLLRQRFSGTRQAAVAAYSLGVFEFDQRHAQAKAADWFRTYIRENPKGALSREARGRLLEALQASKSDEVSALAKDYLRDYPSGPHAALAQRLVGSN